MVVAALFGGHQEAFAVLKEVPVVGDVDVIVVGFVVENAAFSCGGIGGQDFKMVLVTVEALNGQHIGILRPTNAGQVNISFSASVHLHRFAAREVIYINLNDGIILASFGVFETVPLGIKAFDHLHLELAHLALVKLHVGDFLAVGRPEETLREAEFLLIHPVGRTINNMVVKAVVGELALLSRRQILDEQVVVAHKSDLRGIRREGGQTLLSVFRKRLQGLGLEVVNVISGMVRMAVDVFHLRDTQHFILVRAQFIILKADGQGIGMHGEVSDTEQCLLKLSRLVVVDVELAFLEGCIRLAILHGIHAAHTLCRESRTEVKVFQLEIFLLLGRSRKCSENKEQTD